MFPSILAYKYARAFINSSKPENLTEDFISRVNKLSKNIVSENLQSSLNLAGISKNYSTIILSTLSDKIDKSQSLKSLLLLLLKHKRLGLLPIILQAIVELYNYDKSLISCKVYFTGELKESQKSLLKNFIVKKITNRHNPSMDLVPWLIRQKKRNNKDQINLKISYSASKKLLAGFKIEVGFLIFDNSVNKILKETHNFLLRRYNGA